MRILLGLLLVGCFGTSSAQRILYTSQDLSRTDTMQAIKTIRPHWGAGQLATTITVIYKNGLKQKLSRDSIWGFESTDHSIYRSYQGSLYKMEQVDDLMMYTNATLSRTSYRVQYSRTPASPLYATKRKARKDMGSFPD